MNKQEVLLQVTELAKTKEITKEEVVYAYEAGAGMTPISPTAHRFDISQVLYYIGGAIVFLGIAVLLYQNWSSFNTVVKILVTFGVAIVSYIVGVLFAKYPEYDGAANAFFLISALVSPVSLYVLFDKIGLDIATAPIQLAIYLVLTVVYIASFKIMKKTLLYLFCIIFATGLFHYVVVWLIGNSLTQENALKVYEYEAMVTGLSYMLLGYHIQQTEEKALTGVLYAFGSFVFLMASIFLGGYSPNQNSFWELIYPLLVFGIIFASIYVKSKSLLTFGTLFLIAYILKLTAEYFSTGLGWPLALVLAGLIIMVVGYYAVRINKKYMRDSNQLVS